MNKHTGWLMDLYPGAQGGLSLWLLCDGGERLQMQMNFPVCFYAAGESRLLRQAWMHLQGRELSLARTCRRDLFSGERDLLAITVPHPGELCNIFRTLSEQFPDLDYYNADIPLPLRFAAQTGIGLLGRCRVSRNEEGQVTALERLDSPWELEPEPLPLRVLYLSPDCDPVVCPPQQLQVRFERQQFCLNLKDPQTLKVSLEALLRRCDPDLILSDYGDTWLFGQLREWAPGLNPNRDPLKEIQTRNAASYFAYGQVIHRGAQVHLFGRWHIDRCNALLFGEYDLQGVLEQTRVTGLGVQETARKSPGAGITAMQMLTALRTKVLVPVVKQQAEGRKTLNELIRMDRGGLIFQPLPGLHKHVAQIDFASMYPSIMVQYNISPETNLSGAPPGDREEEGLVPHTLRPLLEKRLALKNQLQQLDPRDCRAGPLKARAAALKWLLVVCFGYLGYKNARFGRIESHQAVTRISRELMLQAKETAEDLGFTILHMYIDGLFVQKDGLGKPHDFTPLLEAVHSQTGIPITLEGVYKWLVFPSSRLDSRLPVPNRYFGAFLNGDLKYRGIALRRHDTSLFAAETQLGVLKILAQADDPREKAGEARRFAAWQLDRLRRGKIPLDRLRLSLKLSRELDAYRSPGPAARAGRQLEARGQPVRPGMRVHFWYVYGGVKVSDVDLKEIDLGRYRRLVERAVDEVLGEWGLAQEPVLPGFGAVPG
ncbi:MAG: hypothetical protein JXA13_12990 [Anaerolineales bacterium]|nr:hypothetical protein [Anaerolineales bacterium]